MALESKFEGKCRGLAKKLKCRLVKWPAGAGWPDRILLAPAKEGDAEGYVIFIEFKAEKEKPNAQQAAKGIWLQKSGFRYAAIDNMSEFHRIIRYCGYGEELDAYLRGTRS